MIFSVEGSSIPLIILSVLLAVFIISTILGVIYYLKVKKSHENIAFSVEKAEKIVEEAKLQGEREKAKLIQDGKNEVNAYREQADAEIKERKQQVVDQETKLDAREDSLDRRSTNLDRREEILNDKETKLDARKDELDAQISKVEDTLKKQEDKLQEIAEMSKEEAANIIMTEVRQNMAQEVAQYIKDEEEKAKLEVKNKAKNILSLAIQKYSGETASETTVSTVSLPVEEMKGRIIGREGRNIRTIESLTGVHQKL